MHYKKPERPNFLLRNKGKRAWYHNPGRLNKIETFKQMKKFESLGRNLSKEEQKNLIGGYYATVSCTNQVGTWGYTSMPTCAEIAHDTALYCRDGQGTIASGSQCIM